MITIYKKTLIITKKHMHTFNRHICYTFPCPKYFFPIIMSKNISISNWTNPTNVRMSQKATLDLFKRSFDSIQLPIFISHMLIIEKGKAF